MKLDLGRLFSIDSTESSVLLANCFIQRNSFKDALQATGIKVIYIV